METGCQPQTANDISGNSPRADCICGMSCCGNARVVPGIEQLSPLRNRP
jgi:hypothetical protein